MPRFRRPCLACGELCHGSYCAKHLQELNARRQINKDTPERLARKRLLYGGDYKKRRAEVVATATHCYICQKPFESATGIDVDHLVAGDPNSPLAATHEVCNRSRGNRPL